jgi:predicted DNA-binding transcriptional regulator AlpA
MTTPTPHLIPRGAIRVSDAFERLYRSTLPEWAALEELCVRWDEAEEANHEPPCETNPYVTIADAQDRAERRLRHALSAGLLTAYVHNVKTGIDLQLPQNDWWKFGEYPGIHRDVTGEHFPGPSSEIDGVPHPVFLDRDKFDPWLAEPESAEIDRPANRPIDKDDTQMLSIPDVVRESGISRSRIYDAFGDGALQSVKYGRRTFVRKSELDRFLRGLEPQHQN